MEALDLVAMVKPTIEVMSISGTWPKRTASLWHELLWFTSFFLITFMTITCAMMAVNDFSNISDTIYCMGIAIGSGLTDLKHVIFKLKKEKLHAVMKYLNDPIFTSNGNLNAHITRKIRIYSILRWMMLGCVLVTATLMALNPLFGLSERLMPVPFPVDMKQHSLAVYVFVCVTQSIGTFVICIVIGTYDGMFTMFLGIARAELKVVREKLIRSADPEDSMEGPSNAEYNSLVRRRLKDCVIHHLTVIKFIEELEDVYNITLLVQVMISLTVTVFVGFNCVISPVTSPTYGKCIFLFLSAVTEFSIFCYAGNEIIIQSEKVRDACYLSQWTDCDESVRKILFIIIERSKRPFNITAGKFFVLSLETLLRVFKSSFSFFTVLQRIYSDSDKI